MPYAENTAFQKGFKSPYYNQSHFDFKMAVRKFMAEKIRPFADDWEDKGTQPSKQLYLELGKAGMLASQLYPGPHLKGRTLPGNLLPEKFDYFHELICHKEMNRIGNPGVVDSLKAGFIIAMPPVMKGCVPEVRDRVIKECLDGEKRICLAITDPDAGSDVAGLTCTAKKSPCGKFYIVNGTKKWITNGTFCDYFVTAVRTGGKGITGISLLLIERS